MIITLTSDRKVNLTETVTSHGWVNLAPWSWDGQFLSRPEKLGGWSGTITISQTGDLELRASLIGRGHLIERDVITLVRRWLSLDWDPEGFSDKARIIDSQIYSFIENGGGRFLRGSTFFEDFIKTVCTINTTWQQTVRMVKAITTINEGGQFPAPEQIIDAGSEFLKVHCRTGFRADTITRSVYRMLEDRVLSHDGSANEDAITYKYLLSLHGIGPYAAAHCRMLLHDFSRLPIDSEVASYLRTKALGPDKFQAEWMEYTFLGYKVRRILDKTNWIGEAGSAGEK